MQYNSARKRAMESMNKFANLMIERYSTDTKAAQTNRRIGRTPNSVIVEKATRLAKATAKPGDLFEGVQHG